MSLRESIQKFIGELSDVQLITFCLHYGLNASSIHLSTREIAKALGAHPSTVESALETTYSILFKYPDILEGLKNESSSL
jgi:DNA-directed RNA polymerase specialized sigma24 family protein